MNSPWRASPREVDLLSWFTGQLVPIVFGGIATTFGIAVIRATPHTTQSLVLASVSVAVVVVAFCVVAYFASPRRLNSKWVMTFVPMSLGMVSYGLAAASEWGSTEPFELRWSPIALALLLASLAPYLSAVRLIIVGVSSSMLIMAITAVSMTAVSHPLHWPVPAQPILSNAIVMIATAASAVFSYQVVARTQRWAASAAGNELSSGVLGEAARRRILRQELASVSDHVLPLLKRVATSGVVTDADRAEARELSETLRMDLVERSNRSWLESHAWRMNLTVIDHERLAEKMNPTQRSAILGLLRAATNNQVAESARIVIEFRAEVDGATAVAISADQFLPEGHRLTMLAPHYVTLVAAVDDVEWDKGQRLQMRFRVPTDETAMEGKDEASRVAPSTQTDGTGT